MKALQEPTWSSPVADEVGGETSANPWYGQIPQRSWHPLEKMGGTATENEHGDLWKRSEDPSEVSENPACE